MSKLVKKLLKEVDSLNKSPLFCVRGSLESVLPGLKVKGVGQVGVPISETIAKNLIEKASQAPYGRGEETIVDTKVRRVWQVEPTKFSLNNQAWDALVDGIVKSVKQELGITGTVKRELYKLLIYEKGSFFTPHRDTEKTEGMFATLVVCLPSFHEGGALLVSHNGKTETIEFGGSQAEFQVQYAAFYADCRHEIQRVTKGYRVCLVYNLSLAKRKRQPSAPQSESQTKAVTELLPKIFEEHSLDKVALLLNHEYTEAGMNCESLKGEDALTADVFRQACESLGYHLYLALMSFRQSGDIDYDTIERAPRSSWRRSRSWYDEEILDGEMGEVYDESLHLQNWIDTKSDKKDLGWIPLEEKEILIDGSFDDLPIEKSVHEASGNEGVSVERWYRQAALVCWPAEQYFRILSKLPPETTVSLLAEMLAKSKDPTQDKDCRSFAAGILHNWPINTGYRYQTEGDRASFLLKQLAKIADVEMIRQFLRKVFVREFQGTEGKKLVTMCNRLGWDTFQEELTHFVKEQDPEKQTSLVPVVSIVREVCCGKGRKSSDRQRLRQSLAEELERILYVWDEATKPNFGWSRHSNSREGTLEAIFSICEVNDDEEMLSRFLTHVLSQPERYPLHEILIPATRHLGKKKPKGLLQTALARLLEHCIAELETRTAKTVHKPTDWAQPRSIKCHYYGRCVDCPELEKFLADPKEQVHRFAVREDRRSHLEGQIHSHKCDVTCTTVREGTPYKLVCTKNYATYEREKAQFETDSKLLAELRQM